MMLCKWEKLPDNMKTEEVRKYYDVLITKKYSLILKRIFDIIVSAIMLIFLSPVFLVLAAAIKIDSPGTVFYRQTRVTQFGKEFRIFKFRTMVSDADKKGSEVTVKNDCRITKVGAFIRKYRLDEISQLIDVFRGTMTFVGVRPESVKYVKYYTPKMNATLLLPAGVTSLASIYYKDEAELLDGKDVDKVYVEQILPEKMHFNLKGIEEFGFLSDIKILLMTFFAVLGKEYNREDENLFVKEDVKL